MSSVVKSAQKSKILGSINRTSKKNVYSLNCATLVGTLSSRKDFSIGKAWKKRRCDAPWSGESMQAILYDLGSADRAESFYYIGGRSTCSLQFDTSTSVWMSTDYCKTWVCMAEKLSFLNRCYHACTIDPRTGDLYVCGGIDDEDKYLNDVWKSSNSGETWECINNDCEFTARFSHTLNFDPFHGALIVIAGFGYVGSYMDDCWISRDGGFSWHNHKTEISWSARHSHAVTVQTYPGKSSIIYLSGGITVKALSSNDIWKSTDLGRSWECVSEAAEWAPRNYHQLLSSPESQTSKACLYVVAGLDGFTLRHDGNNTCFGDIWQSTDSGKSWEMLAGPERHDRRSTGRASIIDTAVRPPTASPIFGARYAHSAFYVPGKKCIFVIGGEDSLGNSSTDIWVSRPQVGRYKKEVCVIGKIASELGNSKQMSTEFLKYWLKKYFLPEQPFSVV